MQKNIKLIMRLKTFIRQPQECECECESTVSYIIYQQINTQDETRTSVANIVEKKMKTIGAQSVLKELALNEPNEKKKKGKW